MVGIKDMFELSGVSIFYELDKVKQIRANVKRTMSRAIDLIITYRVVKMLVTHSISLENMI